MGLTYIGLKSSFPHSPQLSRQILINSDGDVRALWSNVHRCVTSRFQTLHTRTRTKGGDVRLRTRVQIVSMLSMFMLALTGCGGGDGDQGTAVEPDDGGLARFCADGYRLRAGQFDYSNNVWGKGNIRDYSQCVLRSGTRYGWRRDWPEGTGFNVKAYPGVIYGHKPWRNYTTTPDLPVRVSDIDTMTVDYDVDLTAQGRYNLAFVIYITSSNPPGPATITHEIMIWMARTEHYDPAAGAFLIDTVSIDGITYDYYSVPHFNPDPGAGFAPEGYDFHAFASQANHLTAELYIDKFLDYLVAGGHIPADEYLASIELGNEVIWGTGELWLDGYRVEVVR